ncbi:hypothetical protein N5079_25270 [Planotetraspora sp. A-T 1434]|uniref:hypothetical protein n=1 Tax=Planotetraspora sp. A-T 1434 TaxID=2979219 RepID=UPI0021C14005|nr:hypothetical protein [Planotetraspora sp. A-T 1434]MCT9933529.1 hypothetical protein [Planotetraspora sp. A-T 1434]
MRRLVRLAPLALLVAVLLSSCVSPAWNDHDYELKAGATAESAASSLQIVRSAVQHEDRLTRPYLKVVLTEAAEALGSVNAQFGGVQPPSDAADQVRDQVTGMTEEAESQVQDLLIEVRRDRVKDPAKAVRELGRLADKLGAFAEDHR